MTTSTTSRSRAKQPQDRKPKAISLQIQRPTKGVELCLDLTKRAEWERLDTELTAARKDPSIDQRLTGGPVTELAKQLTAIEAEMAAATVTFTLTALSHREWDRLKSEHAPRPDDDGDKAVGFNEETIFDVLIPMSVVDVVGPDGAEVDWSPEKWGDLADEMTNAQYMDFKKAAFVLNVGEAVARLPKSLGASVVTRRSVES